MKITQEVREFARLNPSPLEGEGDSAQRSGERGNDEGMAAMSEKFRSSGSEIYVPAAD
jgi:hypothetical protein